MYILSYLEILEAVHYWLNIKNRTFVINKNEEEFDVFIA